MIRRATNSFIFSCSLSNFSFFAIVYVYTEINTDKFDQEIVSVLSDGQAPRSNVVERDHLVQELP